MPDKPGIWQRYGPTIEALLVFVVSAAVLIQILIWSRPFTDTILPQWVAAYSAWVLALLGAEGQARGIIITSTIGSVAIIRECTGVYPMALYLAAVFAYRCTWRRKLVGVVGGIAVIQLLNLIRILSLIYIQKLYPASFEYMHLVVWQSLMMFLTALIWLVWSTAFSRSRPRGDHPG
ncbi:MAG: archaeosortase/exosortase family protein [Deltaproteobacteria bacterium]|jgi:exosortase/archaeosortase family protein|nr:archaeosortase/exosortase family protein [Deltaproteobacteria bacterium]